jgi:hypothetical protein
MDAVLALGYTGIPQRSDQAMVGASQFNPALPRVGLWDQILTPKGPFQGTPCKRRTWTPELLGILERGYVRGRSGVREAVQEILRRSPLLPRYVIWKRASRLELTHQADGNETKKQSRRWSADEDKFLLQFGGEYPVRMIGEKLHRSERAVRLRLFLRIGSSSVSDGYSQSALSRDLGVSPATVRRWVKMDWLKLRGRRITDKSFQEFCRAHGSEIDFDKLGSEMKVWLRDEMGLVKNPGVQAPDKWRAIRKHACRTRSCARCGRQIRGNAYFRHAKTCRGTVGQVAAANDGYF